jgi:D-amino-acid dehydrogenase
MRTDPDVLVIGGGAVGLWCAAELRRRGASVTVAENGAIGGPQSSSHGNTGFVGTHGVSVLAGPGMLIRGLRGLLDPAAPVAIRPGLDRDLLRWLLLFHRACAGGDVTEGMRVMVDMKRRSLDMLRALSARDSLAGTFTEAGMVLAYQTPRAFEQARAAIPPGIPLRVLSPDELRTLEPDTAFGISGALYNEEGAFLRVPEFLTELGRLLASEEVEIQAGTPVTGFRTSGDGVTGVVTTRGEIRPGTVVIAAGASSAVCARQLGFRLALQPVRGYSVTVKAPPGGPRHPVLLAEGRAAVTPLGEHIRLAGILEVCGLYHGASPRRFEGLRRIVGEYLPGLARAEPVSRWTGVRPGTPDSLPFIGRGVRYRNVVFATGHGAMGMGLAPCTGELVAQLVAGEPPGLDLTPFRLDRFGGATP